MAKRRQQVVIFAAIGAFFVSIAGGAILILAGNGDSLTQSPADEASAEQLAEIERQLAEQEAAAAAQEQIEAAQASCSPLDSPVGAPPLEVPKFDLPAGDVTELSTVDITVGEGAEVVAGDCIVANYHGVLADGSVFDSSFERGGPARFSLLRVIKGWQQGIPGMREGGVRVLTIPSDLAYGPAGNAPLIGPDADLVFVVELVEIVNQTVEE